MSPMKPPLLYAVVSQHECVGSNGTYGVVINLSVNREITEAEQSRCNAMAEELIRLMQCETVRMDPDTRKAKIATRDLFIQRFRDAHLDPVFVEEIPNGYWGPDHPAGVESPWYVITSKIGRIRIGWRKRVVEINWSDSILKPLIATREAIGSKIFSDVKARTVGDTFVHCWTDTEIVHSLIRLYTYVRCCEKLEVM